MINFVSIGKYKNGENNNSERVDFDYAWNKQLSFELIGLATTFHHIGEVDQVKRKEDQCNNAWFYDCLDAYQSNYDRVVKNSKKYSANPWSIVAKLACLFLQNMLCLLS